MSGGGAGCLMLYPAAVNSCNAPVSPCGCGGIKFSAMANATVSGDKALSVTKR